jgi:hypothetical protein
MSENALHVYQAINAVQKQLSETGVAKGRKNQQQGYSFRGIDDIYNALSGIMASAELCVLPVVLERILVERETKAGNALFYVTVKVDFCFISSRDGSKHVVTTYGEAMDSADKATNKAMSAAYKYACMQAFCIPTEGDNDADTTTHDVAPKITIAKEIRDKFAEQVRSCLAGADVDGLNQLWHEWAADERVVLWNLFNSQERSTMKDLMRNGT